MKKIIIAICVISVMLSLSVGAFALSYDGDEFDQTKYYALIPWDEISYSAHSSTWHFAPFGSTYFRTNLQHGQDRDPAYAESHLQITGFTYTDGDEPTPETLMVDAVQRSYSQASNYFATFIDYSFANPSNNQGVIISLTCRNEHFTQAEWTALYNYCYVHVPGTASYDLSVTINYNGVDEATNDLAAKNIYFERQALQGGTTYKMFPDWSVFTAGGLSTFGGGYTVASMTLTFDIQNYSGDISIGNLYYNSSLLDPTVPTFDKEVEVEKVVIVEVPMEDLDLWSWIINPLQAFLETELYPGISIGGITAIFVMILVALALIKLWGS